MRRFLIHAFWGVYVIRLGKKKLSFLRAATILFPSLLLAALLKPHKEFGMAFLAIFIIGILIDFAYLKFFPPVWTELSPRQKASLRSGDVTENNRFEYMALKRKYKC